ncbi:hypothetical protein PTKIN_Ptkin10aG0081300 [Pterospermum kingtungense]
MCYVGKATKIFIFIVTVLVVSGLILGFGLFRHGLHKSHKCSGDSCSVFPNPMTPPPSSSSYLPSPAIGSNQPTTPTSNPSPNPPPSSTPTPNPPPSPPTGDPTPTTPPPPPNTNPNPPPQFPPPAAPPPPISSAVLAVPPYNQPTPLLAAPGPVHA